MPTPESAKPFKITTDAGSFVAAFDTEAERDASLKDRNKRAEGLGIKARYVVAA